METNGWQMIKGCIFDYGGTLDTAACHWARVIWRAYQRQGVPVDEQLFREAYVYAERTLGRNPIITPKHTFRDTLSEKLALEMGFVAERRPGFEVGRWLPGVLADLYQGAARQTAHSREVLEVLAKRFPLVLVSNFYGNLHTVLEEFSLDGIFADVVESAVVGVRKPDPCIFAIGVERLGLQPCEVLVVGDSYSKDIAPAKAAGCRTAWLKGEGWDGETLADTSAADLVIGSIDELPSILGATGH